MIDLEALVPLSHIPKRGYIYDETFCKMLRASAFRAGLVAAAEHFTGDTFIYRSEVRAAIAHMIADLDATDPLSDA